MVELTKENFDARVTNAEGTVLEMCIRDRFLKSGVVGEPDAEGLARKHPVLGVVVKLFAGAAIGLLLAGLLLALEG